MLKLFSELNKISKNLILEEHIRNYMFNIIYLHNYKYFDEFFYDFDANTKYVKIDFKYKKTIMCMMVKKHIDKFIFFIKNQWCNNKFIVFFQKEHIYGYLINISCNVYNNNFFNIKQCEYKELNLLLSLLKKYRENIGIHELRTHDLQFSNNLNYNYPAIHFFLLGDTFYGKIGFYPFIHECDFVNKEMLKKIYEEYLQCKFKYKSLFLKNINIVEILLNIRRELLENNPYLPLLHIGDIEKNKIITLMTYINIIYSKPIYKQYFNALINKLTIILNLFNFDGMGYYIKL